MGLGPTLERCRVPTAAGAVALALLVAVLIWQPWRGNELPSAQPASVSESVIVSDSGLRLEWLARGADQTLARPSAQANVRVFYEGSLADGTVFDSNFGREAVSLPLPHMVPGFAEAVQAMRPGDEVLAEFPPELGYGAEGAPSGGIPPSARLRFRIFLESFEEPGGTGPATAPSAAAPPSEPVIGDKNRASGPNEAIVRPEMVRIPGRNFEVGRYEVTFAEWDACVAAGGCNGYRPNDQGWGRGNRPVINVSWNDAQAYVQWLSQRTEQRYRLPTSAEWEYAARAGSTTNFWWGDQDPVCDQGARNGAIFDGCIDNRARTRVVGSFQPNGFGLYDVHGNVWEWVEDSEGSSRVLRGGSWSNDPRYLRSASQYSFNPTVRFNNYGFRVARTV